MATPIWNQVDLTPPPVCTVKSKLRKETRVLNGALKKIIATLESFDIMLHETKLISAVIKHFKADLRTDKSFQLVIRIAHCLKRCEMLNIKEVFMIFEKTSVQCNAFDYQPSRQMLEYVLVRIQGFAMLLKSLVGLCHNCALHLRGKMEIGHFPSIVLTLFSVISRIWSLSKYFIENAFEWYLLLLPLVKVLEPTQIDWLPSGYIFPALPFEPKQAPWINEDKILKSSSALLTEFEEMNAPGTNMEFLMKTDDLGETISREDFVVLGRAEPRIPIQNKSPAQHKKSHVQNKPVQMKPVPAQQTVHKTRTPVGEKTKPKTRKRKRSKSEPKTDDSEIEVVQPVKHFFKTKYTRPVAVPDAQVSGLNGPGAEYIKIVESRPGISEQVKQDTNNKVNEADSTDIALELAKLKQDLSILSGRSKVESKSVGLDPKYKRKVVVVQNKKVKSSVSNESSQKKRRLATLESKKSSSLQRRLVKTIRKPVKVGDPNCDKISMKTATLVKCRTGRRDSGEVHSVSDSSKNKPKHPVQRGLKKKKEMAKLKKQKSKSWVIS